MTGRGQQWCPLYGLFTGRLSGPGALASSIIGLAVGSAFFPFPFGLHGMVDGLLGGALPAPDATYLLPFASFATGTLDRRGVPGVSRRVHHRRPRDWSPDLGTVHAQFGAAIEHRVDVPSGASRACRRRRRVTASCYSTTESHIATCDDTDNISLRMRQSVSHSRCATSSRSSSAHRPVGSHGRLRVTLSR